MPVDDEFMARLVEKETFREAYELACQVLRRAESVESEQAVKLALYAWQMARAAKEARRRLDAIEVQLESHPRLLAPVVAVERDGEEAQDVNGSRPRAIIVEVHGDLLSVGFAESAGELPLERIRVGSAVYLSPDRSMITGVSDRPYPLSYEGRVVEVTADGARALVDFGAHQGQVWVTVAEDLRAHGPDLEGQAVLGDPRISLVTELAPVRHAPREAAAAAAAPLVFAGQWRLKKQLENLVVRPLCDPQAYLGDRHLALSRGGFPLVVLLGGPTGCGKTYAGRWVAAQAGAVLIERQPADYRTPLFGQSENLLAADVHRTARLVEEGQAKAAVLLVNEVEAILLNRTFASNSSVQSTLLAIVDSFLAAIDGLAHRHARTPVAVVLTTNMPELLDTAAISHHRLTAQLTVGYVETPEELCEICAVHLADTGMASGEADTLANRLSDLLWGEDLRLLEATVDGQRRVILARDVISPALVVGIVTGAWMRARSNDSDVITWPLLVEAASEALARHADMIARGGASSAPASLPQFPTGSATNVRVVFEPTTLTASIL
jgi:hypothetical protein